MIDFNPLVYNEGILEILSTAPMCWRLGITEYVSVRSLTARFNTPRPLSHYPPIKFVLTAIQITWASNSLKEIMTQIFQNTFRILFPKAHASNKLQSRNR